MRHGNEYNARRISLLCFFRFFRLLAEVEAECGKREIALVGFEENPVVYYFIPRERFLIGWYIVGRCSGCIDSAVSWNFIENLLSICLQNTVFN